LNLLGRDGTMIIVGVPPASTAINAFSLIGKRRSIGGSLIGGIKETQEMLDCCGKRDIVSDTEQIAMKDINTARERMLKRRCPLPFRHRRKHNLKLTKVRRPLLCFAYAK
jgi:uncharacterized zinc-type alcohol dehydrogenase-like protein